MVKGTVKGGRRYTAANFSSRQPERPRASNQPDFSVPSPPPPAPESHVESRGLRPSTLDFPVVGMGSSAGGLAAMQTFFGQMAPESGMAFVVIMHLSPLHESNAAEILQRTTRMPVVQVHDQVAIQRDHVYIIPPNSNLAMDDGHLHVTAADRAAGAPPVAIDLFFRTLADVHGDRSVCIVLSGTGSDGAVGLTRVKEVGGITMAQSPEDAEHAGMPRAAIATGMVDIVLPVAQMPQRLGDLWRNVQQIRMPPVVRAGQSGQDDEEPSPASQRIETALADVMTLLRLHTRHDFRHYKRATVLRRIERRLQVNGVSDLAQYRDFINDNPGETALLLQDLLISVTNFFRDPEAFSALERDVIPTLFRDRRSDAPVRVWVAGCATGEEAYSLAILLREEADRTVNAPDFQIFATDIDERAIATARAGIYPAAIAADLTPSRLRQFFVKEGDGYRVVKAVREKVLFAAHNVLRDPPFSRLDLVCCRNLLIYLERRAQGGILDMFRFALRHDGLLFLGVSESADASREAFSAVDKKHRIFRATPGNVSARGLPTLTTTAAERHRAPAAAAPVERRTSSNADIHRRSLEQLLPPSVLIDARLNILHLSDGAGRFMEHAGGVPSHNLLSNVSPELRLELRTALYAAAQSHASVDVRNVRIERGGQAREVHLSVRPFKSEDGTELALVVFEELPVTAIIEDALPPDEATRNVMAQLEQENRQIKEHLQETVERSEASTEELKASNEELQAINEELRSATEELETSKEELQSTNEELTTVNYELKMKVEETGLINDDLHNLIATTDIATIFVDRGLQIKRFTPQAAMLFNLIATDIGRPLLDITHKLDYPTLGADAQMAFEVLRPVERSVRATDGRHFLARFLPYRTGEDKIIGAVLNFVDVTALHAAEEKVRQNEKRLRLAAEATRDFAIITLDDTGLVTGWNAGATRLFQWTEGEILGQPVSTIFTEEDVAGGVHISGMRTAREFGRVEDERWHRRKDGSLFYCSGVTTRMDYDGDLGFAKFARDMTENKRMAVAQEQLLDEEQKVRQQVQAASSLKDEFLAVMSHELKHPLNLIYVNAELLMRLPEARQLGAVTRAGAAIRRAADSQSKIIDDLLDLSRVRTGKMALHTADLALNDPVMSIVEAARSDAEARGVALALEGVDQPLTVLADRVRIEQVVWNLLSNAIKFTPFGGRVDVALRPDPNGHHACLTVQDTGRGIDPVFLPQIFEMFSQEGLASGPGGRGLGIGLALVRELVAAHGGEVAAESKGLGHGACFTVRLPLIGTAPQGSGWPATAGAPSPLLETRVLLVDDSPETLELFAELLQLEGARVHSVGSGVEALEALRSGPFDLLISDLGMPDMTGYELLTALRESTSPNRAVFAIALSGYSREADIDKAMRAGFQLHLSKPTSVDDVKRALQAAPDWRTRSSTTP
ncbi:MAG: signal transduction histidine kinase with CheB and CheR [Rhodoferax sp.]|nr:signal transduction histidine kinase with CheB and CheR [Rhodoferax sp.]